jgi:uncharacterized protein (DUF4213/DUF364 family)
MPRHGGSGHDGRMRALADLMLDDLARRVGTAACPRVRALHLPPAPWNGDKNGEFGALELDDGSLGLSYVLLDDSLERLAAGQATGALLGANALDVARWWRDRDGAARTLGFAAFNALSRHVFDRMAFVPPPAPDSIAGIDPQPGEHIGMVGLFPPLLQPARARGARLTVLELRAELAGTHPDCVVTTDPSALAACDKVLITSTVLLNHTLPSVLAHCRRARRIALIGPGAGCVPQVLFGQGIHTIGGSWISDARGFTRALRAGQPWRTSARKFVVRAEDWRGIGG